MTTDSTVTLAPPEGGPQDDQPIAGLLSRAVTYPGRWGEEAISWARGQIARRDQDWYRMCQKFTRSSFGVGGGFASAIDQWHGARVKHPVTSGASVPRGVPVFWSGGQYGHVALSLGDGECISTDARRRGWPDVVRIDDLTRAWGYKLLGWTEDLNGTRVVPDAPMPAPKPKRRPKRVRTYLANTKREIARLRKAREAARARGEKPAPYTRLIREQRALRRQAKKEIKPR